MDGTTVITSKEKFFERYRNAVTTDKVHVAGQRMLIAKEYLKTYGTILKVDILTQYDNQNAPNVSQEVQSL